MRFGTSIVVAIMMASLFTLVWCDQHVDLHRAMKHQSTLNSATNRNVILHTNYWFIKLSSSSQDVHAFVNTLNTQLTRAHATLFRVVHTDVAVVEIHTDDLSSHEIVAMLMSEQRAGTIKWFHRDGENKRKSH